MWLAALGVAARFMGRVGAGDHARLDDLFRTHGVDAVLVSDPDLPTGRLFSRVDNVGERSFFTDRGANLTLVPGDLSEGLLDGIGLVHLSGYTFFEPGTRQAARELMRRAKAVDIPVSVDPASAGFLKEAGAATFLGWCAGAALIFPNEEEAAFLAGTDDPEQQCRQLGLHFDTVVIKRSARGAILGGRSGISARAPARPVDAIDTTGAGDAFYAGFISALMEGKDPGGCLESGNAAGTRAASKLGAQPDWGGRF
jgi:sugar/nucleoside kinase (ribokinase family)